MIDENKLIIAIANWQMTLNPGWSSANDTDTVTYNTLEEVVGLIDDQPTIQPQGIDKDRLIEELDKLIKPVEHLDIKTKLAYNKGVMDAQVIINQQPQTGWIPVSSGELPPIDKEVWITYTYPNGFCDCSFAHLGKDGEWYSKNFGLRLSRNRITAWQPLPQPYKERE